MDAAAQDTIAALESQIADLRAELANVSALLNAVNMTVFSLTRARGLAADEPRHREEEEIIAQDLPGFALRRKGPGEFNKVVMAAGYAIGKPSTSSATSVAERTFTLSAARVFFAKWNHATAAWTLSSGNIVHDDTALPASTEDDTIIPIAAVTWDSSNSVAGTITQYHVGVLMPPAFLPNGTADYDVPSWDHTAKVWAPDVVRGHG